MKEYLKLGISKETSQKLHIPLPFHWPELRHMATPNCWEGGG